MGFAGRAEVVLDTQVHLTLADIEPETAASGESRGLLDFTPAQQVAVETAAERFAARRDGQLNVVEAHRLVLLKRPPGGGLGDCQATLVVVIVVMFRGNVVAFV